MQRRMTFNWNFVDLLISFFVLGLLLWFTYVFFVKVPYAGFYFNPSNGEVLEAYVDTEPPDLLQKGDKIERIANISWESYKLDATQEFFEGIQAGQTTNISVRREDKIVTIPWIFPGYNRSEFLARFYNIWWLGYIFWAFGLLTQLVVRPRDARRRLMVTAYYLTALWLVCGTMSGSHVGGSLLVLRATTWLILPLYLNLHWEFPRPIIQIPRTGWIILYLAGFAFASIEFLQWMPGSAYALGFLVSLVGSIILLIAHFVFQPDQRRNVRLLGFFILLAMVPSIGLGIAGFFSNIPQIGPLTLLALPFMPAAYFFVIYRSHLGGSELRANRIVLIYSYMILLFTVLLILTIPEILFSGASELLIISTVIISTIVAFVSILLFPRFLVFGEKRLLGIRLPYQKLREIYSDRISASTSILELTGLLREEVFPSLLVRQFVFFQISRRRLITLLAEGLDEKDLPTYADIDGLIEQAGQFIPEFENNTLQYPWIRLVLPLRIGDKLIGLWLFGRRDPDDIYSQAEIPILRSLANQTAIALSNILQAEELRVLYRENINRHEQERLRLALELHDGILNQLAVLSLNLDPSSTSSEYKEAYDKLVQRLREMVGDLRPPMLQYGLQPAFEALADNLTERTRNEVNVISEIHANGNRYPEDIELHLFRITQEACENALKHGNPGTIKIFGRLELNSIKLSIEDDGIGIEIEDKLELDELLAGNHFGLAGVFERCRLIGADVKIVSAVQEGVRVIVDWNGNQTQISN